MVLAANICRAVIALFWLSQFSTVRAEVVRVSPNEELRYAQLPCHYNKPNNTVSSVLEWRKGDWVVLEMVNFEDTTSLGNKYTVGLMGQLFIHNVNVDDAGAYTCLVNWEVKDRYIVEETNIELVVDRVSPSSTTRLQLTSLPAVTTMSSETTLAVTPRHTVVDNSTSRSANMTSLEPALTSPFSPSMPQCEARENSISLTLIVINIAIIGLISAVFIAIIVCVCRRTHCQNDTLPHSNIFGARIKQKDRSSSLEEPAMSLNTRKTVYIKVGDIDNKREQHCDPTQMEKML